MLSPTEEVFVKSFVESEVQERYLFMLASRRRLKMLSRLYHHFDFKAKRIEKLPIKYGEAQNVWKTLQSKSGSHTCHVISTSPVLDGKTLSLSEFISSGGEWFHASIYIFDPKKFVLFHDEYDAYLLENTVNG